MGFLYRSKRKDAPAATPPATSSTPTPAQAELVTALKESKETENHPTAALSAMSIKLNDQQLDIPTYQQPASNSTLPSRAVQQPYQQGYHHPYATPGAIESEGSQQNAERRALSASSSSSTTSAHKRPMNDNAEGARTFESASKSTYKQSAVPATYLTSASEYGNAIPSSSPQSYPSQKQYYQQQQVQQSHAQSPAQHSYQSQSQASASYKPSALRRISSGSISSASSYAASEASDVLCSSAGDRSSSGGTSATTPRNSSDRDQRGHSFKKTASSSHSESQHIERGSTPTATSPIQEEVKRLQPSRPVSGLPSSRIERADYGSPVLSQTSSARKTSSRYTLGDFDFMRTLGTGSFGRVHLVRSNHNTRFYAIKVLNKERVVKMKQVEHTNSEREMLERVRHPFLVNLWGTFKDSRNLYMVMDFISGGELFSLLRKSQRFPDPVAKFFAAEVALALDYLHSLDIIYRDLKPENILLAADGHIKITDFGFAKYVPDITWTLCGTPDYLAPEVVQSKGYNKSVDWYALGVLLFEMLAGYPPFFTEDPNPMRLYEKIIAGKIRYPSYFTPEAKDLLKSLLTADFTKRFGNLANGSKDIFGHAYFAEVDWTRLYRKEIPAPYVPRIEGDGDSSNFDKYAEIDIKKEYGQEGADPHDHLFSCF